MQERLRSVYAAQTAPFGSGAETASDMPDLLPGDDPAGETREDRTEPQPVCLLNIPKIDLDVAVAEGTSSSVLRHAAGHFKGTAMPGQTGNFSLIGHRSYVSGQFFNRLDELEIGDPLIVEYAGQTFTYAVSEILVVEPSDTWVLDSTPDAQITLVTCTPLLAATHRLIVKGVLQEPA